jgi:hypothetical protein
MGVVSVSQARTEGYTPDDQVSGALAPPVSHDRDGQVSDKRDPAVSERRDAARSQCAGTGWLYEPRARDRGA